jgi:hypothetical protein
MPLNIDWSDAEKREKAIMACVSEANRQINNNPTPVRIAAALGAIEHLWVMMANQLAKDPSGHQA